MKFLGEMRINWTIGNIMKLVRAINASDSLEVNVQPNLSDEGSFVIEVYEK